MGKLLLSGFNKLNPAELAIVNNILKGYQRKFERFNFDYLKLDLKQKPHSKHGKATLYEIIGALKTRNILTSKTAGLNMLSALDEVLGRLLIEAEHRERK